MKVNVVESGALTRTLEITVPSERVAAEREQVLSEISRRVKLPGFRPGKAPRDLVEKNYAPTLRQELVERLVPSATMEAVAESKLSVVGRPRIENLELGSDSVLQFRAQVEIKPDFELAGALSGLKVTGPKEGVDEEAVEKELKSLAERLVEVGPPVQRPAAQGDYTVVDFVGKIDGQPFEGGRGQKMPLVLGSGQTIPGFEKGVEGVAAGGKATVKVRFPEDYHASHLAGKDAEFVIHVHEVRERRLPAFDDEFAKQVGKFETLDELKGKIREALSAQAKAERSHRFRDQLAEQLVELHGFTPPRALVQAEEEYLMDREKQNLKSQGLQLAEQDGAEEGLRQRLAPLAERRAKLALVLEKVAEREKLSVSEEEFQAEMKTLAASLKSPLEEFRRWARDSGRESGIRQKLLEDKAMNWILDRAAVQEI